MRLTLHVCIMATDKRIRNDYDDNGEDGRPQKIPKTLVEKDTQRRLIIVLERANLETIKVRENNK